MLSRLKDEVVLCHEVFKRTCFFLRLFCLSADEVPRVDLSLVKDCINIVSTRDPRGAKTKDNGMGEKLNSFWEDSFSKIYPNLLDSRGRQLIAEEILSNILVDMKTHFGSRLAKFASSLLSKTHSASTAKSDASKFARRAMAGQWASIPKDLEKALRAIFPSDVERCMAYDLKKHPEKYLDTTLKMCRKMEGGAKLIGFMPTCRSNVPRHAKFDTEAVYLPQG